jgi:zinc transport system substrate-binding protein
VGIVEPQPAKGPSPRQIQALVERVRTDSVRVLFTQRQLPPRSAEVLAESAGLSIHTLDPLGGVEGRTTYETLILYNVRQIRAALEGA